MLAARSTDKIKELEQEIPGSFAVSADMRNADDVRLLIEKTEKKFGRIDILINNAGQGMRANFENINIENYKEIMELNVFGVVRAMQAVIPIMRKQGKGLILNISSRVSKNYFPGLSAYASTKSAVNTISLTAREELKKDNIIVSVFHPKMTATGFGQNSIGEKYESSAGYRNAPAIDTPEIVAVEIAKQIESEEAESMM